MISENEVCHYLKTIRKSVRKYTKKNIKIKSISTFIDDENKKRLSDIVRVSYNIKTGTVSLSNYLLYDRKSIFVSKCPKKHNCHNPETVKIISRRIEKYSRNSPSYRKNQNDSIFYDYMEYLKGVPE